MTILRGHVATLLITFALLAHYRLFASGNSRMVFCRSPHSANGSHVRVRISAKQRCVISCSTYGRSGAAVFRTRRGSDEVLILRRNPGSIKTLVKFSAWMVWLRSTEFA